MAACVLGTDLTADQYLDLGPDAYTLYFKDWMYCLHIPAVLQVNKWGTTILVKMA